MDNIIVYSNDCPKCKVLKAKLTNTGIKFTETSNFDYLQEKGILNLPVMQIGNELYQYVEAIKWINEKV